MTPAHRPAPADLLVEAVDRAGWTSADSLVDVGSGIGRALTTLHLLTGATATGIGVQLHLGGAAHTLAAALALPQVHTHTHTGRADALVGAMHDATGFFFYCPFDAATFGRTLDALEPLARRRSLTLCLVDVPAPRRSWLVVEPAPDGASEALVVCRTR